MFNHITTARALTLSTVTPFEHPYTHGAALSGAITWHGRTCLAVITVTHCRDGFAPSGAELVIPGAQRISFEPTGFDCGLESSDFQCFASLVVDAAMSDLLGQHPRGSASPC